MMALLEADGDGTAFDGGHSAGFRTGRVLTNCVVFRLLLLDQHVRRRGRRDETRTGSDDQPALMEFLLLLETADNFDQVVQIEIAIFAGRIGRENGSASVAAGNCRWFVFYAAAVTSAFRLLFFHDQFRPMGNRMDRRRDGRRSHRRRWSRVGRNGRRRSIGRPESGRRRFHLRLEPVGAAGWVMLRRRMEKIAQVDADRMGTGGVTVFILHSAGAVAALDGRKTFVADDAIAGVGGRRHHGVKVLSGDVDFGAGRAATPRHPPVRFLIVFDVVLVRIAALDVNRSAAS